MRQARIMTLLGVLALPLSDRPICWGLWKSEVKLVLAFGCIYLLHCRRVENF
jgi:hypothetical protein